MTETIESLAESLKAVTDGWYSESLSIDLHDALIDHLTRARDLGPVWRPIESAPWDTEVLVFEGGDICSAMLDSEIKRWYSSDIIFSGGPSYWMPLPQPPAQEPAQ